jgi:ABC-type sugar transport system substrate-binding protein
MVWGGKKEVGDRFDHLSSLTEINTQPLKNMKNNKLPEKDVERQRKNFNQETGQKITRKWLTSHRKRNPDNAIDNMDGRPM